MFPVFFNWRFLKQYLAVSRSQDYGLQDTKSRADFYACPKKDKRLLKRPIWKNGITIAESTNKKHLLIHFL